MKASQATRWNLRALVSGTALWALLITLLLALLESTSAQTQATAPTPEVTLTVNDTPMPTVSQGWPVIVQVQVNHPDVYEPNGNVNPIVLSTTSGSWADGIQIAVRDASGTAQTWPLTPAYRPTGPQGAISLGASTEGVLLWTVSPAASATLGTGTYQVIATLNTTTNANPGAFSGIVLSNPATVTIGTEPSPLPADQQEAKYTLLAAYDVIQRNTTQALADINTLLTAQSNNVAGLVGQGDLQMLQGQTQAAVASYDQALLAFATVYPTSQEPPTLILDRQNSARAALISQSGAVGAPQVAVALADDGVQSPGVLFADFTLTNNGTGVAEAASIAQLLFTTISGNGQVSYDTTLSPTVPIGINALNPGSATSVRLYFDVPATVTQFSVTVSGVATDTVGVLDTFSGTQTLSVNFGGTPSALTITANNASQLYGQPTPPLNNATYNGFVNGDTAASLSGTLICSTTAAQSSPVGSYPISCSGLSSPNYTITYLSGTLTIGPASLTISANNASRLYGQPNPGLTASFTGFVNGDTVSSLAGTLTCTTGATPSSAVGSYSTNCSGLTSTNYTITYAPGQLAITPAPLTITANNASRQAGQPNPSFTVSYSGFVNGDTPASLGGTLSCQTPATQLSPAGTYPINCSGLTSTNYMITFVSGQLTITATCAIDVSASLSVKRSGFSYSPLAKRYAQTLTLTNTTANTIGGPIYVILDALSGNAALYNASGSTSCAAPLGSSYVSIAAPLAAGASTNIVLQFTDPTNAPISYTPRILAGAGQP